jgi:hypothetical protein
VPLGLVTRTVRRSWRDVEAGGRSADCSARAPCGVDSRLVGADRAEVAGDEVATSPSEALRVSGSARTAAREQTRVREVRRRFPVLLTEEPRIRPNTRPNLCAGSGRRHRIWGNGPNYPLAGWPVRAGRP